MLSFKASLIHLGREVPGNVLKDRFFWSDEIITTQMSIRVVDKASSRIIFDKDGVTLRSHRVLRIQEGKLNLKVPREIRHGCILVHNVRVLAPP